MVIKLFTSPTCKDCKHIKRILTEKGIAFEEHDTSTPDGLTEYTMLGVHCQRVPILAAEKEEGETEIIEGLINQLKFINSYPLDSALKGGE